MLRKGFTLIELLIVITIIAILAGAAIPYVQDYIDDARLAKARADLGELRSALIRYETSTGKSFGYDSEGSDQYLDTADTFQNVLVGPYLQSALTDPWGTPYYISNASSTVYSAGADRDISTNVIETDFRPRLAPTRVFWSDIDRSGKVEAGDELRVRFTRRVAAVDPTDFEVLPATSKLGTGYTAAVDTNDSRYVVITIGTDPDLQSGRDALVVKNAVGIKDEAGNNCASLTTEIKPAQ